jgi:hypothetical protein
MDAELGPAGYAKRRKLVPFEARPQFDSVAGKRLVTFLAGMLGVSTLHFDGDDVEFARVVSKARLMIEIDCHDARACFGHGFRLED